MDNIGKQVPPVGSPRQSVANLKRGARTEARPLESLRASVGNRALSRALRERACEAGQDLTEISLSSFEGAPGTRSNESPVLQRKAEGSLSDRFEDEADRVATEIMRAPAEGEGAKTPLSEHQASGNPSPSLTASLTDGVLRSPGEPLDSGTREMMERRFGHDFGQVRLHHGTGDAEAAAASVQARAFTVGSHVVFGAGEYTPRRPASQWLLAHELTHTVQQRRGASRFAAAATLGNAGSTHRLMRKPRDEAERLGPSSQLLSGSPELLRVWQAELVIGLGSGGEFVQRIQRALLAEDSAALPRLGPDGRYGQQTKAAVASYQRRHHLVVDGVVGPETIRSLDDSAREIAVVVPPSAPAGPGITPGLSLAERFDAPRNPFFPMLPGGISTEQTFVKREMPALVLPGGKVYRTLSLVGSARLSPANSLVTLSKGEAELEFEKFGTSITFKQGAKISDSSFSAMNVDLGKSNVSVGFKWPNAIVISCKLPKTVELGRSKLVGDLRIELELRVVPNPDAQPPEQMVPIPEQPWWERVKKTSPAIYWIGASLLAVGGVILSFGERLVAPVFIMPEFGQDWRERGPTEA